MVWRAAYEAFGKATPDENPDGDGTSVTFNIRFPGQYYDAETGLHYNRFRYYDPGIGRYISADPIGQAGGVNVFTYGLDDPINNFDPTGLNWVVEFAINTNQGLAAFADGFIPFADPFAAAGFYDPCDPTLKWSYYSGAATLAAEIGLAAYGAAYGFGPIGGGAAAEAAAAGAEGASNSEPGDVSGAADAIEEFLGGPGEVKRNKAGDPVIIKDDRKVRFDSNNPHGDEPHFHLERKEPNGRWRDAGPKHRYYFKKD